MAPEERDPVRLLVLAIYSDCLRSWVFGCLLIRNRVRSSPIKRETWLAASWLRAIGWDDECFTAPVEADTGVALGLRS